MDLNQINAEIEGILETRFQGGGNVYFDDGEAHKLEDSLYHAFVKHVAETADGELKVMALKVLETEALAFRRWYE